VGRGFDEHFSLWILDPHSPVALFRAMGFGYNVLKDVVVFGVLAGVITFVRFRMQGVKRLAYGLHATVVLGVIATMMLSDVLYDGGSIAAEAIRAGGDTTANISRIAGETGENLGRLVALVIAAVTHNPDTAHAVGAVGFWTHVFLVFAFLNYLPYGKHFHVITSLPNVIAARPRPAGTAAPVATSSDALMEKMAAAMELPDPQRRPDRRRSGWTTSRGSRCSTSTPAPSAGAARTTARRTGRASCSRPSTSPSTCATTSTPAGRGLRPRRNGRHAPRVTRPRPLAPSRWSSRRDPPRCALGLHHLPGVRGAVPGDDHVRRQDRRHAAQPGDAARGVSGGAAEDLHGARDQRQPLEHHPHGPRGVVRRASTSR
jgi:hypothetical protein